MNFIIEEESKTAIIKSNVEKLDITNVSDLKAELLVLNKKGINNFVLDLSNTRYCDSSGLSGILTGNRLCKDSNGKFVLAGLNDNVLKLIKIAQLDRVLAIEANLESALKSL
jgi:anti-anti-sigma factor